MESVRWLGNFVLGLMAWFVPTLAVIGTNLTWFSRRQIAGSLVLSLLLGTGWGMLCIFIGNTYASLLCGIAFSVSSERLLHWLFPRSLARFGAVCGIVIFFGVCERFFGVLPLCVLLGIYGGFSLFDIGKKWRRPKKFIPEAPLPGIRKIPPVASSGRELTKPWKTTPNIYFLFLESIHSARAMKDLFAHDDFGLEEFLEENGFAVFPRGHANLIYTRPSLNTLVNMDSLGYKEKEDAPDAFRYVKSGGYRIGLFDSALYTFAHYVPWAEHFNLTISPFVRLLYEWTLPFFVQSAIFLRVTGGVDPFTDKNSFQKVFDDLKQFLSSSPNTAPVCAIIRFGASHVPETYRYPQRAQWIPKYVEEYGKAVGNIKTLVAWLLKNDPEACVAIMGDHGTNFWRGAFAGPGDVNATMAKVPVEPETVARGMVDTIMALRFPGRDLSDAEAITPATFFHRIFDLCGCPELPPASDNNAYMVDPDTNMAPFLIAKDGRYLPQWKLFTPEDTAAGSKGASLTHPDAVIAVSTALAASGDLKGSFALLEKGVARFPDSMRISEKLGPMYARLGQPKKALGVLEPFIGKNLAILLHFSHALSLLGSLDTGLRLLEISPLKDQLSPEEMLWHMVKIALSGGDLPRAHDYLMRLQARKDGGETLEAVCWDAFVLEALGKYDEAFTTADGLLRKNRSSPDDWKLHVTVSGLAMRQGDYEKSLAYFPGILANSVFEYSLPLSFWYAGALEKTGAHDKALETLTKLVQARPDIRAPQIQLGLFANRHRLASAGVRSSKKQAYEHLRFCTPFFEKMANPGWIDKKYGEEANKHSLTPLMYYAHFEQMLALDIAPQFNSVFYLLTHRHVFIHGTHPLFHFLNEPPYLADIPSPAFSLDAYRTRHPDENWFETNPLVHSCLQEKRNPTEERKETSSQSA